MTPPDEAFPVELIPPDIGRWAEGTAGVSTGISYVQSFEAARPGPHVLITALVHGNEICGAIALDRLLREGIRPERGRLSYAFVNVAAYQRFDPAAPSAARFVDEDFNRLWSPDRLDGGADSAERRRARELRPLIDSADLLLDLHSLQQRQDALTLCGPLEKGLALARTVGYPAVVVADAGHAAGIRLRDYGAFGHPASARNALLVECGQHWAEGTDRVAIEACLRFLIATGTIDPGLAERFGLTGTPPPQSVVKVTEAITVESESFVFAEDYRGMEVIPHAGTEIARSDGRAIVTPYDDCVLVMPSPRLHRGQTAVRLGRLVA